MKPLCIIECVLYNETAYALADDLVHLGLKEANIGLMEELNDFTFDTDPEIELRCKETREYLI